MQSNFAKPRNVLQKCEAVIYERLGHWIAVLLLARNIETGENTRVLIEARTIRKAAQRSLDGAYARIEFLIGQALLIYPGEGKQASIAACF